MASSTPKAVWLKTSAKEAVTAFLESGFSTLLFDAQDAAAAKNLHEWSKLGRIDAILAQTDGSLKREADGTTIGHIEKIANGHDLESCLHRASSSNTSEIVVMDASDWQIIPAENLVAAFQTSPAQLYAVAGTAGDCATMLGALEIGTDGVVLHTNDPAEVRKLSTEMEKLATEMEVPCNFSIAVVSNVHPVGIGDRACVDLCSAMIPMEGLLVGNFARGMFLVHSECSESSYINSRPFRVNAGPVHAYLSAPGGRTSYLSELKAGDEVQIVNAQGKKRLAIVGRVKIEKRPLVLIEASSEGENFSILLQNAETVKLVGPANDDKNDFRAISVAELKPGDKVLVHVDAKGGARHTGVAIEETIVER